MIDQIFAFLKENQLASGGLVIATFGAALAYLRDAPAQAWKFLKRRTVLEIEILDRDPAYSWLVKYINKEGFCKKARRLTAITGFSDADGLLVADDDDDDDDKGSEIYLVPAPGLHFFWYKRTPILLSMVRSENTAGTSTPLRHQLEITTLYRFKPIVEDLLEQARLFNVVKKETNTLKILLPSYNNWYERGECETRSLDSIILEGNSKEKIIKDIKTFLGSKDWYNKVGIPYKRGYLLYGQPGNGKTSLVKAIATHFNLKLCVLSLEGLILADTSLPNLFNEIPKNSVLLIEDIDCAVGKREDTANKVPMSVLLNCLDGISSPEGKIFFMTTNYKDKLDQALTRSGRCDYSLFLGNADEKMVFSMFDKFFPGCKENVKLRVPEGGISLSSVQEHLIRNRNSFQGAVESFSGLFR